MRAPLKDPYSFWASTHYSGTNHSPGEWTDSVTKTKLAALSVARQRGGTKVP